MKKQTYDLEERGPEHRALIWIADPS